MSPIDDAKNQLGELLITGFEGKTLSDDTAAFLSQARIGGIILFKQNYESPEQVATLINEAQACSNGLPLWVSVDHEGGRVQRFGEPFTKIPAARKIGDIGSPNLAFEAARVAGAELKAVGVNLNFAPICDINTNPANPVIGDRSYGETEEIVSRMVTATVRGYLVSGVQPCMKHFPGHGDTNLDSHFDLPSVSTPVHTLHEREFRPFTRASKSRCQFLMTAHVIIRELDTERPATLSKKILQDILRGELRYSRIIISDDMEMKAMTDHFGEQAPVMAVEAGCDALIYRSESAARHAYEVLLKALDDGPLSAKRVLESAERLRAAKKDCLLPYAPVDPTTCTAQLSNPENLQALQPLL